MTRRKALKIIIFKNVKFRKEFEEIKKQIIIDYKNYVRTLSSYYQAKIAKLEEKGVNFGDFEISVDEEIVIINREIQPYPIDDIVGNNEEEYDEMVYLITKFWENVYKNHFPEEIALITDGCEEDAIYRHEGDWKVSLEFGEHSSDFSYDKFSWIENTIFLILDRYNKKP